MGAAGRWPCPPGWAGQPASSLAAAARSPPWSPRPPPCLPPPCPTLAPATRRRRGAGPGHRTGGPGRASQFRRPVDPPCRRPWACLRHPDGHHPVVLGRQRRRPARHRQHHQPGRAPADHCPRPAGWTSMTAGYHHTCATRTRALWCSRHYVVIFDHLRPSGHIMPDHAGDRGAAWMVLAPHDHLHIKQMRTCPRDGRGWLCKVPARSKFEDGIAGGGKVLALCPRTARIAHSRRLS